MAVIQRSCGACDEVDDGPRNQVDLGDGRVAYFHLDCDPHPELDEDAATSQFRAALEAVGQEPPAVLTIASVDASDPATHYAPEG